VDRGSRLSRNKKLENLMMNYSVIFMGMFEEAFSALADKMTEALAMGTAAMADELSEGLPRRSGGSRAAGAGKKIKHEVPLDVRIKIQELFSEIREEAASQWPKKAGLFDQYVSSRRFDKGIEIVERYDFRRPRWTERLSDEVLASYVFLLQSGDRELGKMFKELADWQAGLPKPPWSQ
jgi:hypothetical protein